MSPLKPGNCYFEMEVLDPGEECHIMVGLVPGNKPRDKPHNWKTDTTAYYRSDGKLHTTDGGVQQKFGLPWVAGDVVGCGIKLDGVAHSRADKTRIQVFFTVNGQKLCTLHAHLPPDGLHPAIGMCTHSPEGARVRLSLNASWESSDIIPMSIDTWEEDWVRQHGIRLNGQLLEYTGRAPTVGLAQTSHPLDTRNHYFEIEIVDPGVACHIAIGVARKDYPKNRLPGWNKGSIAYHADDGKIFIGNGFGEPFGPKCYRGEIMGCGILFPREYKAEVDMCENLSLAAANEEDHYHSSDSEDDDDDEGVDQEGGTKVQVFFTRNGKTIGKREIRIARGGFYPTIGMQTPNEKVGRLEAYGIFVKIPGFKKNGLVHKSQMSNTRLEHPEDMVANGDRVYCKVISVDDEGRIGMSMKVVNQTSGTDLDPNHVQASLDEQRRKTGHVRETRRINLGAVLDTTCSKCGGKGHFAQDCFHIPGATTYELLPDIDYLRQQQEAEEEKGKEHIHHKKKKKDKNNANVHKLCNMFHSCNYSYMFVSRQRKKRKTSIIRGNTKNLLPNLIPAAQALRSNEDSRIMM
ncbi:hypothetical protein NP493_8g05025 [Ridgeia piscesae]|uniref:CCHC-type domain-containing protein n=1 Tax=Ridgeia piscesae TaxID=27915 RepID=A0AAD9ULE5_RIDPI|nr:hypothetical protein NP493_8g05025 [Ridgeia piscesae]